MLSPDHQQGATTHPSLVVNRESGIQETRGNYIMKLQQYSSNNVIILRLEGRVDSHSTALLREQITVIATNQTPNMIVDLATVSFMDSSGLATLVYGMKHCRDRGGNLCLCNAAQPIRMILELTRLDKAIEIFPTTADAIAALTGSYAAR